MRNKLKRREEFSGGIFNGTPQYVLSPFQFDLAGAWTLEFVCAESIDHLYAALSSPREDMKVGLAPTDTRSLQRAMEQ